MSKDLHFPSLAQHFDPPEGYIGHFGWLVGFSADTAFMNVAAERFTGLTKMERARQGRISLALFLNDHNPPITMQDAPGVAHLPFADLKKKPCRLVHAKVAMLGFCGADTEQQGKWCVRLLISTGNWTQQTLEQSLDIAWVVDVCSDKLHQPENVTKMACADIKAANDLIAWLRDGAGGFFDVRLLKAMPEAQESVDGWITKCVNKAKGSPRFFDNRKRSLIDKLPELVKNTGVVKRNYLALGSGFYEGGKASIPQKIIAKLQDSLLLTKQPEIDIFVNPTACQAIAALQNEDDSFVIRPAVAPAWMQDKNNERNLHAKFLFSANYRDSSNHCSSAWIYLGSGNLTNPGFAQKMSTTKGNLEAGIVFAADGLLWYGNTKGEPATKIITNLLPIEQDEKNLEALTLEAGEPWEAESPSHFAPPVAWLVWHESEGSCELRLPTDVSNSPDFVILDAAGSEIQRSAEAYLWTTSQPQQVRCRWLDRKEQREGTIPVMDALRRIAAVKLLPIEDMEEAWLHLADFFNPPEVDDPDELDGNENEGRTGKSSDIDNSSQAASYPVRQMMELLENIAAKQTEISEYDWPPWCCRLEQTLALAKDSEIVEYFAKSLKLNPLAPLRYAPFRPAYAEDDTSDAGKRYEKALGRIEASWGVNDLLGLGDSND